MNSYLDWNVVFAATPPCIVAARLTVCGVVPDFCKSKAGIMAAFVNFVLRANRHVQRVTLEGEASCWAVLREGGYGFGKINGGLEAQWREFCEEADEVEKHVVTAHSHCLKCQAELPFVSEASEGSLCRYYSEAAGSQKCLLYLQKCCKCGAVHTPCYGGENGRLTYLDPDRQPIFMCTRRTIFETSLMWSIDLYLLHNHGSMNGVQAWYNELCKKKYGRDSKSPLDRRRVSDAYFRYVFCVHLELFKQLKDWEHGSVATLDAELDKFTPLMRSKFQRRWWRNHACQKTGCQSVLIGDGNMKNRRPVCKNVLNTSWEACPGVQEGQLRRGCTATPVKGPFCQECSIALEDGMSSSGLEDRGGPVVHVFDRLVDCRQLQGKTHYTVKFKKQTIADRVVAYDSISPEILEDYHSRKVKKAPSDVLAYILAFSVKAQGSLAMTSSDLTNAGSECQTSKDKTAGGNTRTAGIFAVCTPCGIIVSVEELFGSESISQVYGLLCKLWDNTAKLPLFFGYDDACHLARYVYNLDRFSCGKVTWIQRAFARANIFVDRMHAANHVDEWCKKYMNPNQHKALEGVNTEACEQVFSYLSRFSFMTRNMSRARYNTFLLHICHSRNLCTEENLVAADKLPDIPAWGTNVLFDSARARESVREQYDLGWWKNDDEMYFTCCKDTQYKVS